MFELQGMEGTLTKNGFKVPDILTTDQKVFLLHLPVETHLELQNNNIGDKGMKEAIIDLMYSKKEWDSEILSVGGISYFKISETEKRKTSDGTPFKKKYRVAFTSKNCNKLLKFRIKTASGAIFSVASKTDAEAQFVVDSLFGKKMYTVSQMLY